MTTPPANATPPGAAPPFGATTPPATTTPPTSATGTQQGGAAGGGGGVVGAQPFGGAQSPAGAVPPLGTLPPFASPTPPPPSAVIISAPTTTTAGPVVTGVTQNLPPDALGVVVEGMMLADVSAVDERGCMTVKALDGKMVRYRVDNPVDVGEQVVIAVERPLFGPATDSPSALPRMSAAAAPSPARSRARDTDSEARTTIATVTGNRLVARAAGPCESR
jgi:hypothetical protein